MNYEEPRQNKETGLWFWTNARDGVMWAVGNCAQREPCPKGHPISEIGNIVCRTCKNTGLIDKPDACPGHETADGAALHQREYRLAHVYFKQVSSDDASSLHRCMLCNKFTADVFGVEGDIGQLPVCVEHKGDTKAIMTLVPLVKQIIHS